MILIVDGDPAHLASLERLVKFHGFPAVAVSSGMEALALLELQMPDLIILELEIKDMDGLLLLKSIRADPNFARVPILIYTTNFADEQRRAALRYGAQAFLVKGTLGWGALMEQVTLHHPKP